MSEVSSDLPSSFRIEELVAIYRKLQMHHHRYFYGKQPTGSLSRMGLPHLLDNGVLVRVRNRHDTTASLAGGFRIFASRPPEENADF